MMCMFDDFCWRVFLTTKSLRIFCVFAVFGCVKTAYEAKKESCLIRTFSAGKMVCKLVDQVGNFEIVPTIDSFCVSDLKRVIYEVFCHVIRGDLRQEDALLLLSDVTVRNTLIFYNVIICSSSTQPSQHISQL